MKINMKTVTNWKWWAVTFYLFMISPVILLSASLHFLSNGLVMMGALLMTFVGRYFDPVADDILMISKAIKWANRE